MNKQETSDFNDYANNYRQIHTKNIRQVSGTDSFYFSEQKVQELKKFEKDQKVRLLDIGCGDGASEVYFHQYFPQMEITGIDISEQSVLFAQNRNIPNCNFMVYDGKQIPYPDLCFDIIFIACVLHHIQQKDHIEFLKEAFRVLKKNGRLYLFEHNPLNPITKYVVKNCEFDKGVQLIWPRPLKNLFITLGFKSIIVNYTLFFPRYWLFKPFLSIEKYLNKLPVGGQYYLKCIKD